MLVRDIFRMIWSIASQATEKSRTSDCYCRRRQGCFPLWTTDTMNLLVENLKVVGILLVRN